MTHDLHLKYKFTDRGGSNVYEKYHAEDRITLMKPLGEVRLKDNKIEFDDPVDVIESIDATQWVCWRNHKNIACNCPVCKPIEKHHSCIKGLNTKSRCKCKNCNQKDSGIQGDGTG